MHVGHAKAIFELVKKAHAEYSSRPLPMASMYNPAADTPPLPMAPGLVQDPVTGMYSICKPPTADAPPLLTLLMDPIFVEGLVAGQYSMQYPTYHCDQ